jgi:hypothetical protein
MKLIDINTRLTFRQKAFLGRLLELYNEVNEPVHYTVVAGRLGLSSSSAYDMLRVLEQKRMVASHYMTPKEVAGPGRASVLFYPTAQAVEYFAGVAGEISEKEEWEELKVQILESLRQVNPAGYRELIQEVLKKSPSVRTPLAHCATIVAALLLGLKEARHKMTRTGSVAAIVNAPASKLRMSILAGLVLGLSLADSKVRDILGNYRRYTEKYEVSLKKLNRDSLVSLHSFTRDVWEALEAKSTR